MIPSLTLLKDQMNCLNIDMKYKTQLLTLHDSKGSNELAVNNIVDCMFNSSHMVEPLIPYSFFSTPVGLTLLKGLYGIEETFALGDVATKVKYSSTRGVHTLIGKGWLLADRIGGRSFVWGNDLVRYLKMYRDEEDFRYTLKDYGVLKEDVVYQLQSFESVKAVSEVLVNYFFEYRRFTKDEKIEIMNGIKDIIHDLFGTVSEVLIPYSFLKSPLGKVLFVLFMKVQGKYSIKEVADIQGCSVNNIRKVLDSKIKTDTIDNITFVWEYELINYMNSKSKSHTA